MKSLFTFCILLLAFTGNAQEVITKFYDEQWNEITEDKATFYADFVKNNEGYKCLSYWKKTKKRRGESTYLDTIMKSPTGLQKLYNKNGVLEDSVFYNNDGKLKEAFHFFPNGQLECRAIRGENGQSVAMEAYDEEGKRVKNYIYEKEPEPKGGIKGWAAFLKKSAPKELYTLKNMPTTVKIQVRFIVDEYGNVTKPKIIESSGMKHVDAEAIRIIIESPTWTPAIYKNKPIKAGMTQPFTFELMPVKSKG